MHTCKNIFKKLFGGVTAPSAPLPPPLCSAIARPKQWRWWWRSADGKKLKMIIKVDVSGNAFLLSKSIFSNLDKIHKFFLYLTNSNLFNNEGEPLNETAATLRKNEPRKGKKRAACLIKCAGFTIVVGGSTLWVLMYSEDWTNICLVVVATVTSIYSLFDGIF